MKAKVMALGGVTAALAVVIMSMGGMIPLATYVIPVICCILLQVILPQLGRSSWVWYCAVSLLGMLLCPDKEAAAVFVFIGFYPIVKPWFDRLRLGIVLKVLFFNAAILIMYWLLIHLFGMTAVANEFAGMGTVMVVITLLLGNVTFFMLDLLLGMISKRKFPRRRQKNG